MDFERPDLKQKKLRRNLLWATVLTATVIACLFFLRAFTQESPLITSPVWKDTVKRGRFTRQVRGPGTLVPREDRVRLIPAETDVSVLRIRVLPGEAVEPNTVLMDLTNAALEQQVIDARLQLQSARADYANTTARLESELLTQQAGAATVKADQSQAQLQATTDKSLYDLGVISGLTYNASKSKAEELLERNGLEQRRLSVNKRTIATQLAVQDAKIQQAQAILTLRERQLSALTVTAGIHGVLVDLPHQVGEHVAPGTTLAKVIQPDQLKAALKIGETQAHDVQIGQAATIDTHNGFAAGHVTRIDPSVQNGTVTIDVTFDDTLPAGVRPDLSVDGTIDLDHLDDVLYVGRPAFSTENSTLQLFRVSLDGRTATQIAVTVGRASSNNIQVSAGLSAGETVIISDMSLWNRFHEVRLKD